MSDRIFGAIALMIALAYGYFAFFTIRAPFQYDPLGPETWPQILSIVAAVCCAAILIWPDEDAFKVGAHAGGRLLATLALLVAYAALFEPAGFTIATGLFCAAFSVLLGGGVLAAAAFGVIAGVGGYAVGVYLLALNLPEGLLAPWL